MTGSASAWTEGDIVTVLDITGDGVTDMVYRTDVHSQLMLRKGIAASGGGTGRDSLSSGADSSGGTDLAPASYWKTRIAIGPLSTPRPVTPTVPCDACCRSRGYIDRRSNLTTCQTMSHTSHTSRTNCSASTTSSSPSATSAKPSPSTSGGFAVAFRLDEAGIAGLKVGKETPGLLLRVEDELPHRSPAWGTARAWLEVRDAREAARALTAAGVPPLDAPFSIATGWTVEFADPWGNVVGFTDYTKRPELARTG